MTWIALCLFSAIAMEPLSALLHKHVLHGVAWTVHRSHHQGEVRGLEANDIIPLISASLAIGLFATGAIVPSLQWLSAIASGVTLYGAFYAIAHDLYIHRRLPLLPARVSVLEPIRVAHLRHHETGTDDWGLFWPAIADTIAQRRKQSISQAGQSSSIDH